MIRQYLQILDVQWNKSQKKPGIGPTKKAINIFAECQKYCQLYPQEQITPEQFEAELVAYAREVGGVRDFEDWEPLYETCEEVEDLINQAMDLHSVKFSPKGDEILNTQTGDHVRLDDFRNMVLVHADKYRRDSKRPDGEMIRDFFGVEETSRALEHMIAEQSVQYLSKLRALLKYRPGFEDYSQAVVRGILSRAKVDPDMLHLSTVMVLQWIWQVKSFLYNKPVPDPIFLNIQSTYQGGGKTEFVNRISFPLRDYTDPDAKLLHALDERERARFTSNYIVIFDELVVGNTSGEYGQAIAAFKQILTAKLVNPRTMYTTKQVKMKRNYSGIGTSNPPMVDTIYDETGMRRFFEITFNLTEGSIFEDLQKIDPVALWQGVNEEMIGGFIPVGSDNFNALREVQATYKRNDLVDAALEYGDLDHAPILDSTDIAATLSEVFKKEKNPKILDIEDQHKVQLVPAFKFRHSIIEWIKENVETGAARYVKGVHAFPSVLTEKGFCILRTGKEVYVVCEPPGGTMAGHTPPPAAYQPKPPEPPKENNS